MDASTDPETRTGGEPGTPGKPNASGTSGTRGDPLTPNASETSDASRPGDDRNALRSSGDAGSGSDVPDGAPDDGAAPPPSPGRPGRKPFVLRLPADLHEEIRAWAEQDLRSLNGQIEYLLREAVRRRTRNG